MVGQEILVLFIMVRIRAPQPRIQPPFMGGLIYGSVATVRKPQRYVASSTMSRFYKQSAVKSLGMPRSHIPARRCARELSAPQPKIKPAFAG